MPDAETFVNRLVELIAGKAERKTHVKVRTLLKGFGYERRSQQVISEIHRLLNARGLAVELSVSSPKTLDERVWLISSQAARALAEESSAPGPKPLEQAEAIIEVSAGARPRVGFVVDQAGLAVTSWGAVDDGNSLVREVKVRGPAGTKSGGVVFFAHRVLDVALLWLDGTAPWPSLPLGDPTQVVRGETLLEFAYSAPPQAIKVRTVPVRGAGVELLQMDADVAGSVEPGRPFVNANGEVVGIGVDGRKGVPGRLALPIDYLTKDIMKALERGREASLQAQWCVMCGSTPFERGGWFCTNCGHQWENRRPAGDSGPGTTN